MQRLQRILRCLPEVSRGDIIYLSTASYLSEFLHFTQKFRVSLFTCVHWKRKSIVCQRHDHVSSTALSDQVDPSGPLATLRKLLLSDESLATFRRWIIDHWYAAALIILAAVSLLVRISLRSSSLSFNFFFSFVRYVQRSLNRSPRETQSLIPNDTIANHFYIRDDRGVAALIRNVLRVSRGSDEKVDIFWHQLVTRNIC